MTDSSNEQIGLVRLIADEVQALHKGRGIQASDLDQRLGPNLRELAGGDPATSRRALTIQINSCAAQLATDMRLAVTASLALSGHTKEMPFLRERIEWLSEQIGRDYRTSARRVTDTEWLLALQSAH